MSLPKIQYIHRIYMVLANPTHSLSSNVETSCVPCSNSLGQHLLVILSRPHHTTPPLLHHALVTPHHALVTPRPCLPPSSHYTLQQLLVTLPRPHHITPYSTCLSLYHALVTPHHALVTPHPCLPPSSHHTLQQLLVKPHTTPLLTCCSRDP